MELGNITKLTNKGKSIMLKRFENAFFIFILGVGFIGWIGLLIQSISPNTSVFLIRDNIQNVTLVWSFLTLIGYVVYEIIIRQRNKVIKKKHIRLFERTK